MGKKDKISTSNNTSPTGLDSQQENKIQKKFHLDPSEKVLYVIKARKKHRNGTLSITEEHICFQSNLLGTSKKKLLAFNQIVKIENQDKDAGVKITSKTGKSITFHFKQNESVYFLIESQWESTGNMSGTKLGDLNSSKVLLEKAITSASLHKHFHLPDTEYTITELTCSLKSTVKVKHYGKLFITQNYFCFYSHFLTSSTKRVVKLRNISSISKVNEKIINIQTTDDVYKFSSFINRDEAFNILEETYEKAKLDTSSLPATPVLRSRSNSFDGSGGHSRKNSNTSTSLDVNKLQETLANQKGHSRQNSDNNNNSNNNVNNYTPTFKRTHSRQNSENTSTTTNNTASDPTTSPSSTPIPKKSHSRQNSENNDNSKSTTTPPNTTKPITTTTTTNPNNNSGSNNNTTPKLSERVVKVEQAQTIPKPQEPVKPSQTQQTKTKYRSCCFGAF